METLTDICAYIMIGGLIALGIGWIDFIIRCLIKWTIYKRIPLITAFELWLMGGGLGLAMFVLPFAFIFSGRYSTPKNGGHSFGENPIGYILAILAAFVPHAFAVYIIIKSRKRRKCV
jgi:hypothetical protein